MYKLFVVGGVGKITNAQKISLPLATMCLQLLPWKRPIIG